MKKAIALYRVSTDKQDEEMQRIKVREYCKINKIDLIDEYIEFDVSGYKTQLKNRKELLKILSRAEDKQDFDYLVVYIFDRIIRREDEAPFVLSILGKCNIECIEVTTGEHIRNADMTDKLMNYIRFWNAEFESVKTAQRVSDALRTKNQQNTFAGGRPAFGYELYQTNNVSNKGRLLKDIRIKEDDASTVRDIFDMYVNRKMGTLSIAEELNTNPKYKGTNRPKRRKDKDNPNIVHEIPVRFRQSSLPRMLRNTTYIGRLRYNTVETTRDSVIAIPKEDWKSQDYRDDLRLIDDDMFLKAQELLIQNRIEPKKLMKGTKKTGVLCSGLAYCECGAKLYSSFSNYRRTNKDGTQRDSVIYRYVCRDGREANQIHKESYGKTYYAAKKYDTLVESTIVEYLNNINIDKLKDEIEKNSSSGVDDKIKIIDGLKKEKDQCLKNIDNFEKRIDDDIDNMDIYIKGVRRNESRSQEIELEIDILNEELLASKKDNYDYKFIYDNFKNYHDDFLSDDMEKKRLIIDNIVDKIVFKNNGIKIILKTPIRNSVKKTMELILDTRTYGVLNTQINVANLCVDFND